MEFLFGIKVELQPDEGKVRRMNPTSGFGWMLRTQHLLPPGGKHWLHIKQREVWRYAGESLNRSPSAHFTFTHPTPRCCLGWSQSAMRADYPTGSFSFCGWDAPVSVWSRRPTSSAALSRPPPLVPAPLLPPPSVCLLDSSLSRRRNLKIGCLAYARDVHCHRLQSQVCSTGHLQAGGDIE